MPTWGVDLPSTLSNLTATTGRDRTHSSTRVSPVRADTGGPGSSVVVVGATDVDVDVVESTVAACSSPPPQAARATDAASARVTKGCVRIPPAVFHDPSPQTCIPVAGTVAAVHEPDPVITCIDC